MDPFTEKLLERTRARRENLQKKMAERPNAASRQMVKRPLADTNGLGGEAAISKAPQASTKPSPSKRKCSEENVQAAAGEENQEPRGAGLGAPQLADPPTDRKPPAGPASIRSASSMEKTSPTPAVQVQVQPVQVQVQEEQTPSAAGMKSRLQRLAQQRRCWEGGDPAEAPPDFTPASLLTRQAEAPPTSAHTTTSSSSETPVGRRGRLANLAATIGSWEDDLSYSHLPAARDAASRAAPAAGASRSSSTQAACVPVTSSRLIHPSPQKSGAPAAGPAQKSSTHGPAASTHGPAASTHGPAVSSLQKSSTHGPAASTHGPAVSSPQKCSTQGPAASTQGPAASTQGPAASTQRPASSTHGPAVSSPQKSSTQGPAASTHGPAVSSPQKSSTQGPAASTQGPVASTHGPAVSSPQKSSTQGPAASTQGPAASTQRPAVSSPQKAEPVVPPLKNQVLSRGPNSGSSPQRPEVGAGAAAVGTRQEKTPGGAGVRTFLERFGERCQERSHPNTPAGGAVCSKVPSVTPSGGTPTSRLLQERFRAGQAASTTSAELTQRQKMERESELALIRSRFQKGNNNMWKSKEAPAATSKLPEPQESEVQQRASSEPQEEPSPPSAESIRTPQKSSPPGLRLMVSPPALTSSPRKVVLEEQPTEGEEEKEVEMNVDQSINSAVINGLFEGILEPSEDQEEEEDALNISSMSLLTPLAETIAAVVKSPERKMMTSTPASSFLMKSTTPESLSSAESFQSTHILLYASSDYIDITEEEPKLPYSVDAYRSTRMKELERPGVKQVIVRKEKVAPRAEEPSGTSVFSIRQKMKALSAEVNLQQTVVQQASQALNCCTDEEHGKGSQVEAEAQRLLLVATARRQALVEELERLKGELTAPMRSTAPDSSMSASRGSISLKELRLPLKADFVCSTANRAEATKHSFFLLLRAGAEKMVATPLASTHRGLSGDTLTFPTTFTLSDVSTDFEVDVEVYALVQKPDVCNEKKKKSNKSKAITPKRFLAITKSVQAPAVASPGGPHAVRTSSFLLVGSHTLTLASIGKSKFALEKVPFLCPLEGHVHLQLQCEVGSRQEDRGFLNMFEDVSGLGAWHRRWCVLSGFCISFWRYPDDERRKSPIGRINLANCTSPVVGPVNREFCARPNTLELITVRPQREEDRDTLVSQVHNNLCVTKTWLSADTKEERNVWMGRLNQILLDLRMWKPGSFQPQ